MTETVDSTQRDAALALIDRSLGEIQRRELIAASEVADLLLDVRTLLTLEPISATPAG